MIRWRYVVPRLILFAAIVGVATFAFDPLLQWFLVRTGQSLAGARVTIGGARWSWTGTKLSVVDVEVANPRSSMKNLFQADEMVFDLDANALSRRKFVVSRGEVRGLRVGTQRGKSGSLEESEAGGSELGSRVGELGEKWFDNAVDTLEQDLEENLQSPRLARELMQRWPSEYERLETRAEGLRDRIQRMRELAQSTRKNPLRAVQSYPQITSSLDQIRQELLDIRSEMDRLSGQAQRDKDAIAAAKQHDTTAIREKMRLENLDGQTLSKYLLGPEVGPRVATAVDWLRWGRKYLPTGDSRTADQRGQDILFPGCRAVPDLLVRFLSLQGQAAVGQETVNIQGSAKGITTQPAVYGRPMELELKTDGNLAMLIRAVLDHGGKVARDRIVVDGPAVAQPARVLGSPDRFSVSVSPGTAHVWAMLDVVDEAVSGEILIKQTPVELVPHLGADLSGDYVADALEETTRQLDSLEAAIALSGTLDDPTWRIRSNLGNQLAVGINQVVQQRLSSLATQMLQRSEVKVNETLSEFEQLLAAKRESVLHKLQLNDAEVRRVLGGLTKDLGMGTPEQLLGDAIRLKDILQR